MSAAMASAMSARVLRSVTRTTAAWAMLASRESGFQYLERQGAGVCDPDAWVPACGVEQRGSGAAFDEGVAGAAVDHGLTTCGRTCPRPTLQTCLARGNTYGLVHP